MPGIDQSKVLVSCVTGIVALPSFWHTYFMQIKRKEKNNCGWEKKIESANDLILLYTCWSLPRWERWTLSEDGEK